MTTRIKICGITRLEDALLSIDLGADALGFNFYPPSPRYLGLEEAQSICNQLPPFGLRVGIFVMPQFDQVMEIVKATRIDTIQLHGDEPPEIAEDILHEGLRVWKAVRVKSIDSLKAVEDYPCDALVLDAFDPKNPGGTGKSFNWDILSDWNSSKPWILSGGLTPDNVAEAIQRLSARGVDVASGVESSPGIKDPDLLRQFITRAKDSLLSLVD